MIRRNIAFASLVWMCLSMWMALGDHTAGQTSPRAHFASFSVPGDAWVSFSDEYNSCGRGTPVSWTGCNVTSQRLGENMFCARNPLREQLVKGGTHFYFRTTCLFSIKSTYKRVSNQTNLPPGRPALINQNIPLYFLQARTNNTIIFISGTTPSTSVRLCNGFCSTGVPAFDISPGVANAFRLPYMQGLFTIELADFPQSLVMKVYSAVELGQETLTVEQRISRVVMTPGEAGTFKILVQNSAAVRIYASYSGNNCTTNLTDTPDARQNCLSSTKDSIQPNLLLINLVTGRHVIFYTIENLVPSTKLEVRTEFVEKKDSQNATPNNVTRMCQADHYYHESSGGCAPCPVNCRECVDKLGCVACKSGFNSFEEKCVQSCPPETFAKNNRCTRCMPDCLECSSDSYCNRCKAGMMKIDGTCRSGCPIRTYLDNSTCKSCRENCELCKDDRSCDRCITGFKFDGQFCKSSCADGTFMTPQGCKSCSSGCETCVSYDECLSCPEGFYLSGSKCVRECPLATYPISRRCEKCPVDCDSCAAGQDCIQCRPGFMISSSSISGCVVEVKPKWVEYYVCNKKWESDQLAVGPRTICEAGGLITMVASVLTTWNVSCDGQCDPGALNKWLKNNGGYTGSRINHGVLEKLGVHFIGAYRDLGNFAQQIESNYAAIIFWKSGNLWSVATKVKDQKVTVQTQYRRVDEYSIADIGVVIIYRK